MSAKDHYIKKFSKELGRTKDFVEHVRQLENSDQLSKLANFFSTQQGARYLIVQNGSAPVIDFRHFFAAMMQRMQGLTKTLGNTNKGNTLLLGVLNEVNQCVSEIKSRKLNSCFSREDLGSNRLGAEFGERVIIARAEGSKESISNLLYHYLQNLRPLPPEQINKLKMPTRTDVAIESFGAVMQSIGDWLVPSAY